VPSRKPIVCSRETWEDAPAPSIRDCSSSSAHQRRSTPTPARNLRRLPLSVCTRGRWARPSDRALFRTSRLHHFAEHSNDRITPSRPSCNSKAYRHRAVLTSCRGRTCLGCRCLRSHSITALPFLQRLPSYLPRPRLELRSSARARYILPRLPHLPHLPHLPSEPGPNEPSKASLLRRRVDIRERDGASPAQGCVTDGGRRRCAMCGLLLRQCARWALQVVQ